MKSKIFALFFLTIGCATAQTPTPSAGKVLISADCRNPSTDTPVWSENVSIDIAKGESRCLWVKNDSASSVCVVKSDLPGTSVGAQLFQPIPQTLSTPAGSSKSASKFFDVLAPSSASCVSSGATLLIDIAGFETSPTSSTLLKVGSSSISVNVLPITMPNKPTIPLMVAGVNSMCIRAMSNGKYVPKERECTDLISSVYTAHRITPYASEVIVPPVKNGLLDLDANGFPGMTAKDTWISNAHPNFINIPNPNFGGRIPVDYLKAAEATIKAQGWQGKAWIYAKDEPHSESDYTLLKDILKDIRTYAPSLKTMVTCKPRADLEGLIDVYTINNVFEPFSVPKEGWIYTACDAHGCGSGDRRNGQPVKLGVGSSRPDYGSINSSSAFTRSFAWSIIKYGAKAGLYYNTMEWTNLLPGTEYLKDPANFGSYGDGALFFPQADGTYWVSHRMKLIRESMFDLEYLLQMNADERKVFDGIFTSNTVFSKDYGDYQALIDRIRRRLGGVLVPTPTAVPQPSPSPTASPTPAPVVPIFKCRQTPKGTGFVMECEAA